MAEFFDVDLDLENTLRHVSLKYVSREGLKQIQKLNYPGTEDLLSPDKEKAQAAAARFALQYFMGPARDK